jgi:GSCFA family
MQFQLPIQITAPEKQISYHDKILLIGSCFTEHIGNALDELKFRVLQNPHGILFDPISVCNSLNSYIESKKYTEKDLFQLNEVWNSWQHHSRFSNIDKEECLRIINESQQQAYDFLKQADWLVITLGSSFYYLLNKDVPGYQTVSKASPLGGGLEGAANCHRAPAQWFTKHLLAINETAGALKDCIDRLLEFNKHLKIIFTISPVRHIRDGVVENNRSKARLIESVHQTIAEYNQLYYFPAYELIIDVLRDYRFYDIDLAHPNYMATEFVMEKFKAGFIDEASQKLMEEVRKIVIAKKHKAFQPATNAHKQFLKAHFEKTKELLEKYPFLSLREELDYFNY